MARLQSAWRAGLLAASIAIAGCAGAPVERSADEYRAAALRPLTPGTQVALLPVKSPPTDLAAGDLLVQQQLEAQLRAAGLQVVPVDAARFEALWANEVRAVGGLYDPASGALRTAAYGTALSQMARHVARETHAAFVIDHRLVVRHAELSGSNAQWDGQRRTQPTLRAYGSESRFDGTTTALSVQLLVLSGGGELLLKSFGGTSLPYAADVREGRFVLRPGLFDTADETADGVRVALRPLLGS